MKKYMICILLGVLVFTNVSVAERSLKRALEKKDISKVQREWRKVNRKIKLYSGEAKYKEGIAYINTVLELLKKYSINETKQMEEIVKIGETRIFEYQMDILPPLRNSCRQRIAKFYMLLGDYGQSILWAKKQESYYGDSETFAEDWEERRRDTLRYLEKEAKKHGHHEGAILYAQAAAKYSQIWAERRLNKKRLYEEQTNWKKYTIFSAMIIVALLTFYWLFRDSFGGMHKPIPRYAWRVIEVKLVEYVVDKHIKIKSNDGFHVLSYIFFMTLMIGLLIFVMVIMLQHILQNLHGNQWLWYLFLISFMVYVVVLCLTIMVIAFLGWQKRMVVVDIPTKKISFYTKDAPYHLSVNDIRRCKVEEEFLFEDQGIGIRWVVKAYAVNGDVLYLDIIVDYRKIKTHIDMWKSVFGGKLRYDKNIYDMDYKTFVKNNFQKQSLSILLSIFKRRF